MRLAKLSKKKKHKKNEEKGQKKSDELQSNVKNQQDNFPLNRFQSTVVMFLAKLLSFTATTIQHINKHKSITKTKKNSEVKCIEHKSVDKGKEVHGKSKK